MFQDGVYRRISSAKVWGAAWTEKNVRRPSPNDSHATTHADLRSLTGAPASETGGRWTNITTSAVRFPLTSFRPFLTLFSKFFASFPHGTCTLSVSHQYLDLERIYVPLWAAIPSNPTRWKQLPHIWHSRQERESHPLCCPFPRDLAQNVNWRCFFTLQLGTEQSLYRFTKVISSRFSRPYWGNPC